MDCSDVIVRVKKSIPFIVSFDAENQPMGTGSGFVFFKKGIVVTCNHVVKDATSLVLRFPESEEFVSAKVLIKDEEHDLALLRIEDENRPPLEMGDLSVIREGFPVIFSGYPVGLRDLTTHQGIISAVNKDITGITSYLIDGTVNSGNSGCPLMNHDGKVIGVVNAKRRVRNDLLEKVERMRFGALSMHGVDIVEIYQALINNVQLGIGYAIPASYIPNHKELTDLTQEASKQKKIIKDKINGK
jgi:S1-C subfamily serine protease